MPDHNKTSTFTTDIINAQLEKMRELGESCSGMLQLQIRNLKKKKVPDIPGHLVKSSCNGHVRWKYVLDVEESKTGRKEIAYINKANDALLKQLSLKLYSQCSLIVKEKQLAAVNSYLRKCGKIPKYSSRIMNDPDIRNILEITRPLSEELLAWQNAEYPTNPQFPEALRIHADGNHIVRSKSEAIIVSELVRLNIPFRYECALHLKETIVYPDFMIRHPVTGEYYLWEHFGMMDDTNYAFKAGRKIEAYIQSGYIPMLNLILTSETRQSPLDYRSVRLLIQNFFVLS